MTMTSGPVLAGGRGRPALDEEVVRPSADDRAVRGGDDVQVATLVRALGDALAAARGRRKGRN